GLIGSQYFVDHPPIKLENIEAMVNLDMVGRIRNQLLYIGGEGTADALEPIIKEADAGSPLELKSVGKGGRGPSDHQSFSMKKVPVLFLFSGMHPDYHRPTDKPDKINYQGMDEVVAFAEHVVDLLAMTPKQEYVAKYDSQRPQLGVGSRGTRATLGVVPDYGTDESTGGVKITGTTPGSPAEKAGLKDGDTILQMNDRKIDNLYDLTDVLAKGKPGDNVTISIEREKQRVELHATLAARND
ncbi:MAG TPA: M28 family peptidase, partial [Tepidisphaeraceae bacterium]